MWATILALSNPETVAATFGGAGTVGASLVGYQVFRQRNGHAAVTRAEFKEFKDEVRDRFKELKESHRYLNRRLDNLFKD